MNESARHVNWGVLGTARIAERVADAIRLAEGAQLFAIASRSLDKALDWANDHGAERAYGDYEALLDDPHVDAVYIPLPPSLHCEWTIKAAERGKHVLCEKPLATSTADAERMAAACAAHNVQLMDGVMWRHHPRAQDMRNILESGSLGPLKRVTSALTFPFKEYPENEFRFDRARGGGALLDIGWYCVGATLWAFGALPTKVFATGRYQSDVDRNLSALLWFEGERMASFECGFDAVFRKWIEFAGTERAIVCDDFSRPWNVEKARLWTHDNSGQSTEHVCDPVRQEVRMIERFSKIVRTGRLEQEWPKFAVDVQGVCEAIDRSARTESIVELATP